MASLLDAFGGPRNPATGCVPFMGDVDKGGYGRLYIRGKRTTANRVMLALHLGRDLTDDEEACHSCDCRTCIAPEHLFPGTTQENTEDRHSKGRTARGTRHGCAKLNEDQVEYVKTSPKTGRALAAELNVSRSLISAIRNGRLWAA